MVLMTKSLRSSAKQINLGRPSFEKKSKLRSAQLILRFDKGIHLPVKGTRTRCVHRSTKIQVRSNIEVLLAN
jgi:hypothetical protein